LLAAREPGRRRRRGGPPETRVSDPGRRCGQASTGDGGGLKFNSVRCGKAGQFLPVSDGSPHLLAAEATVGGAGWLFRDSIHSELSVLRMNRESGEKATQSSRED
jgi:hypothetical protein